MKKLLIFLAILPGIFTAVAQDLPRAVMKLSGTEVPQPISGPDRAGGRPITMRLQGAGDIVPISLLWLSRAKAVGQEQFRDGNLAEEFEANLSPEVWAMIGCFSDNEKLYYVIRDNIDRTTDDTYILDVAEATFPVDFDLVMPDGSRPDFSLWRVEGGVATETAKGNIIGADISTSIRNRNFSDLMLVNLWGYASLFREGSNPDDFVGQFNIVTNRLSDDFYFLQRWNASCPDYTLVAVMEHGTGDAAPVANDSGDYAAVEVSVSGSPLSEGYDRYPASYIFETQGDRIIGFAGPVGAAFKPSYRLLNISTSGREDFYAGYSLNEIGDYGTEYALNNFYRMVKVSGDAPGPGLMNLAGLDLPFCGPYCTPQGGEWSGKSWIAFNPVGDSGDFPLTYGNDCPIAVMVPRVPDSKGITPSVGLSYTGLSGDYRGTDLYFAGITLEKEGKELASGYWGLREWCDNNGSSLRDGVFTLRAINNNIKVDDIDGCNSCEFVFGHDGRMPPQAQLLQFRDSDGKLTDRFDRPQDGMIEIMAGLFDYHFKAGSTGGSWYTLAAEEPVLKVEYAPIGGSKFTELPMAADPSRDYMPGYGRYYSASLADVNGGAPYGWFDLRITLKDMSGNISTQTISPAFKIESLAEMAVADCNAIGAAVAMYDIYGRRVDAGTPGRGIYIMNDGCRCRKIVVR